MEKRRDRVHNLEIEFKQLLNEQQFYQILEDYSAYHQKTYYQTNYYLTHPILERKKMSLRVRQKNDYYELTLKQPQKIGLLETNIDISQNQFNRIMQGEFLDNEIFENLQRMDVTYLESDLYLTTRRCDIILPEGLLSIDENEYMGKIDYELELEVDQYDKGARFFKKLLEKYDIEYQENCDSKIKRLLDYAKEKKAEGND